MQTQSSESAPKPKIIENMDAFGDLKKKYEGKVGQLESFKFYTSSDELESLAKESPGVASVLLHVLNIDPSKEGTTFSREISREQIQEMLNQYFWVYAVDGNNTKWIFETGKHVNLHFLNEVLEKGEKLSVVFTKKTVPVNN